MDRKYIDCREYPSDTKCTVTISADTEDELLEIAAQHAVRTHGHKDSLELRAQLRQIIKTGTPSA
jgi:predicted small metal-binding protein